MLKASPSATRRIPTNPCATVRWKACASSGTCSPAAMAKPGRTAAYTTRKAARPTRAALPWKETTYSNSAASSAPPCSAAPPPGPAPNNPLRHGLFVGAPPRCEPGGHTFAPGGCSYNTRWAGLSVGAPPDRRTAPVRTGPAHIRTRGGCSYDTRRTRFICRSTAGSPDRPVRTGPSHIRTRRVLLQHEVGRLVCRSTAPGANRPGTYSHPGRVLLRHEADQVYL